MNIDEMSSTISEIQEQIMFQPRVSVNDYSELLAAVEELRYFLKVDLQVPPTNQELQFIEFEKYTF